MNQTKQAQFLRSHFIFETAFAVIETKAKIRLHQQKSNDDSCIYIQKDFRTKNIRKREID
ncbi:uncharacterized protein METZ01_LOCUS434105 [marine metagenome]|uniref:Uncharacterized protein n=1 Tax=marine metagenome TaxID=408172 RepID=A0A382YED0_9ZZZZ